MWFCWPHRAVTASTHWGSLHPSVKRLTSISISGQQAAFFASKQKQCKTFIISVVQPALCCADICCNSDKSETRNVSLYVTIWTTLNNVENEQRQFVSKQGWKSAPPSLKPWRWAGKWRFAPAFLPTWRSWSISYWRVGLSGSIPLRLTSRLVQHQWQYRRYTGLSKWRGSYKPEGAPVDVLSNPHLWSWALDWDW